MNPAGAATARVRLAYERIRAADRPEVWIHLADESAALAAAQLIDEAVAEGAVLPLAGLVMAAKDNIDVAGMPTTAACPAYSYAPSASATAVQRLVDLGVVFIGKTNLDQFATGLVGTRSPYGVVRNALRPEWMSGGSSSGSAVAVALGIVDAALGTDTAGSGRVPAALNGIVGLKPSRGFVSALGVVPACRSLDCVSVLAATVATAWPVLDAMTSFDPEDAWSRASFHPADDGRFRPGARMRIGVAFTDELRLSESFAERYEAWTKELAERSDADVEVVRFDPSSLFAAGDLLYDGAFVAERAAAVGEFVRAHMDEVDPVVGRIIEDASALPAARYAADLDRLVGLRRECAAVIADFDLIALPTTPTILCIDEVQASPFTTNASFGRLNNFCNLLDYCAATVPAGLTALDEPFGINLFAPAGHDRHVAEFAATLLGEPFRSVSDDAAPSDAVLLAVVGAHLSGQPLNAQLTDRGARLVSTTTTAPIYRLSALATTPPKPGLWRVTDGSGAAIEVEVWALDPASFGTFTAAIPSPLGIGSVTLIDGSEVRGFVCEPYALESAPDISSFGGWRAYLASRTA